MPANWISDGSDVPVQLQVSSAPCREWQLGRFTFRRARRRGLWTCQVSDRGAGAYRTPLGAFLAVRRMHRANPAGPVSAGLADGLRPESRAVDDGMRQTGTAITLNVAGAVAGRNLAEAIQREILERRNSNWPGTPGALA